MEYDPEDELFSDNDDVTDDADIPGPSGINNCHSPELFDDSVDDDITRESLLYESRLNAVDQPLINNDGTMADERTIDNERITPNCQSPELFDDSVDDEITRELLLYDSGRNTVDQPIDNGDITVDQPIDNDGTTVDQPPNEPTVDASPMNIVQPVPSIDRAAQMALINRWLTEGTDASETPNARQRRGVAVGWMLSGRGDEQGQLRSFGHYMRLKKDKLLHQVNVLGRQEAISDIFKGISIFVNGYTVPPALELRSLIQAHGGEYHVYFEYGRTTYTIASDMASSKQSKTRKNEVILRPEFIVDSVAAGRLLDTSPYLLLPDERERLRRQGGTISQAFGRMGGDGGGGGGRQVSLDARDADFIDEYYARSRLHLISTLAQEMRDYVHSLREQGGDIEAARSIMSAKIREGALSQTLFASTSSSPLPPTEKAVFHLDLDCFFVSVALRTRPELRGRPVAITHSSGSRDATGFSEIASCSYEARARGVKNGSLVRDALRRCTNLVCLPYQFDDYRQVSKMIYDIVASHTLDVRAVSCDEMYIDATSLIRAMDGGGYGIGDDNRAGTTPNTVDGRPVIGPIDVANYLRARIKELTGCPASVGIGPNPLIARLATRFAKPDGVRWVPQREVDGFSADQKLSDLPGVGASTLQKLGELGGDGMRCGQLRGYTEEELTERVGKKTAAMLYRMCQGVDDSEVVQERTRKSVSCDINYGIRFEKEEELQQFLGSLAAQLEKKLQQARMKAGSLTLKVMVRSADAPVETAKYLGHGRCDTHTRCARIDPPCGEAARFLTEASKLMRTIRAPVNELRGIGIQLSRLAPTSAAAAARPLADQLATFFSRKRSRPSVEAEEGRRQPKKKGSKNARGGWRPDWDREPNEEADHRRRMKDFMTCDIVLPRRLHVPPSKLEKRDQQPFTRLKFFGETKSPLIRVKLAELMLEEPTPSSLGAILHHGWALLKRGELMMLKDFARNVIRASESDVANEAWLLSCRFMCREWEKEAYYKYYAVPDLLSRESRREMNEVVIGAEVAAENENGE